MITKIITLLPVFDFRPKCKTKKSKKKQSPQKQKPIVNITKAHLN